MADSGSGGSALVPDLSGATAVCTSVYNIQGCADPVLAPLRSAFNQLSKNPENGPASQSYQVASADYPSAPLRNFGVPNDPNIVLG